MKTLEDNLLDAALAYVRGNRDVIRRILDDVTDRFESDGASCHHCETTTLLRVSGPSEHSVKQAA
jgi:hypothetical protein